MSEPAPVRTDADLMTIDISAAITRGLAADGQPRRELFADGAVAAALRAGALGIGPYPLRYLARYVRAAGRTAAAALPEPLVGAEAIVLAQSWLAAAGSAGAVSAGAVSAGAVSAGAVSAGAGDDLAADDLFARWLESVAAVVALRRRAGRAS